MTTLWQIGRGDDDATEFALGVDDFHLYSTRFPDGPLFVVGRSQPGRDWPHVQPGPRDAWAGSREHTFTVRFAVDRRDAPGDTGAARVVIDLADTHRTLPPTLRIGVNDFVRTCPTASGSCDTLEQRAPAGRPQRVVVDVPAGTLCDGENTLTITTSTGCWLVHDRVALEGPPSTVMTPVAAATVIRSAITRQTITREPGGDRSQWLRLLVEHAGNETSAEAEVTGRAAVRFRLRPGRQHVDVPAPVVESPSTASAVLRIGAAIAAERAVEITPVRPWAVYLLHHTHLDVGYTHVQSEVETLQWRHLERAVELARATADHPDDARFRWNPEGLWAVDSYLRQAKPEARAALLETVRAGGIGLDAFYANELTGVCRPEELFELTACARRLARETGVPIDSAMTSDIPGFTWGLVPALAHAGIRYLSVGPNRGHRIGYVLREWGDRPFYWESPCGTQRVLCWTAGKGYSWFHGTWRESDTFAYDDVETALEDDRILDYLQELDHRDYPYDLVQLRYNVGSDNGPPDPGMADFVRLWNERHVAPRLVVTTTRAMGRALETRHGASIPTFRGDFTPYWEDGAASSSRETAQSRAAAERLVQAATLWSILDPDGYPDAAFREAWRNVLLFSEHTWGSWNSVSDPDCEFTRSQWTVKQSFAEEASRSSEDLVARVTGPVCADGDRVRAVLVFNTCSWPRDDLVVLPAAWDLDGAVVRDAHGRTMPAQRLRSGALAFLARAVPPLGAARFTLHDGAPPDAPGTVDAGPLRLSNGRLDIVIDEATGDVRSLRHRDRAVELVDAGRGFGLNAYFYVAGRCPDAPLRSGPARIEVVERGPLVASLRIESDAPGCEGLVRELRIFTDQDRLDLVDRLDKRRVLEPEGVHLAFPFCVPEPAVRFDVAWGQVELGRDQLPGACGNHLTTQRWVDVSNDEYGVTLATVDAPLVEIGAITADPTAVGWIEKLMPSGLVYSYVMNNYWETNYLAGQEGPAVFRYSIQPHGPFDAASAKRFGIERTQPLIAVPVAVDTLPPEAPVHVEPGDVMITSIRPSEDGQALIARMFNACEEPREATLRWSDNAGASWISSPFEDRIRAMTGPIAMRPWEVATVRSERG